MEGVRVRLVFDDDCMVGMGGMTKGDELQHCWLLLHDKHLSTISDLVFFLLNAFALPHSCPHGLILSKDGFVFPPFESTSIIKDNDIICVRRKTGFCSITECEPSADEEYEANKEKILSVFKGNEELQIETLGHKREHEKSNCNGRLSEDTSTDVKSSKRKSKQRKRKAEKNLVCSKRKKSIVRKDQITDSLNVPDLSNGLSETLHVKKIKDNKANKTDDIEADTPATLNKIMSENLQQNAVHADNNLHIETQPDKKISRSARRKKLKRKLMRGLVKEERNKINREMVGGPPDPGHTIEKQIEIGRTKVVSGSHVECQSFEQRGDEMDDIVFPVVVRPGHIRFETADRAAQRESENNEVNSQEDGFRWNGITDKRKGQKWGRQKCYSNSNHNNSSNHHNHSDAENEYYSEMPTKSLETPEAPSTDAHTCVDFNTLSPLLSLPVKGDVIAYRLVELSENWRPELSSFRVGEVSHFQEESNTISLQPVADHPLDVTERPEEDTDDPPLSLYKEDGSLEIDYGSLVEVKAMRTKGRPGADDGVMEEEGAQLSFGTKEKKGEMDGWDEIQRALSEKKAELCVDGEDKAVPSTQWPVWGPKRGLARTIHLLHSRHQL